MPLHPQARASLDALAAQGEPGWEKMTHAEGREAFNGLGELFGIGPDLHAIEDQTIDGRTPIPIRIYYERVMSDATPYPDGDGISQDNSR